VAGRALQLTLSLAVHIRLPTRLRSAPNASTGLGLSCSPYTSILDLTALPGGDLVEQGIADLAHGVESMLALLVAIGAPRLRRLGLPIPESTFPQPEHRLYERLAVEDSDSAHSRYNALVRRLVSFENAAECAGGSTRSVSAR